MLHFNEVDEDGLRGLWGSLDTVPVDTNPVPHGAFRTELEHLLNRFNMEAGCNTPDFILSDFLYTCLQSLNHAVKHRATWYGRYDAPGQPRPTTLDECRQLAGRVWCRKETAHLGMNPALAEAFAQVLAEVIGILPESNDPSPAH